MQAARRGAEVGGGAVRGSRRKRRMRIGPRSRQKTVGTVFDAWQPAPVCAIEISWMVGVVWYGNESTVL